MKYLVSRELCATLAIMAAAAILCAPLIFADAPAGGLQGNYTYMALALHLVPTPTPIPPPLDTLVLQPIDLRSGYERDMNNEATNAAAAATYPDPAAALRAFEAQGRETSWFVRYGTTQYFSVDALVIGNQVFRFLTADGATQGQAYILADVKREYPTFQAFSLGQVFGHPSIALRRTIVSNGTQLVFYYISVQIGRYVTNVQIGGLASVVDTERAYNYIQRAVNRLNNTPQSTSDDATTSPSIPMQTLGIDAICDELTMH